MKKEARRKRQNASPPRQTSKPGAATRGEESSAQPAHERKATGRRRWWFAVALLALGWAIYTPCLSGPFLYDDYDLKEVHSTVRTGRWQAIVNSGRPLPYLTYLANHRWGGFDPFSFHATSVVLHGLNAVLLWCFLNTLLTPERLDRIIPHRLRVLFVYGVPLLFLTSPIQTESVAYISSRPEVLGTTFYIAALWVFASALREHHRWLTALLVVLLFAGAVSCKQDKLSLPFVILMMDYLLLAKGDWRGMKNNWPTYALFGIGGGAGFFVVVKPFLFAQSAGFNLPWAEYLFTQFRVLFVYLRLLLVPVGLNVDWHLVPSETLWEHLSWLGLIVLAGLASACVYLRQRAPLAAFGGVFFFVVLAPTSSFFPLLDFAAERRLYLPSIGFFLVVMVAVVWLFSPSLRNVSVVATALVVAYAAGTYTRSQVWSDELLLWQDAVAKSPDKHRPLNNLGRVYDERGEYATAAGYWRQAEKLVPAGSKDHAYLLGNLGLAHARLKDYRRAVDYYERAIKIAPRVPQFWAQLGVAQLRLGRKEEGFESFRNAFKRRRRSPEIYLLRGQEYFLLGDYQRAASDFARAVNLRPEDQRARRNLRAAEEMLRGSNP